jgi:hypothetical protein
LAACATAFCVGTVVSGQSQEPPEGTPPGPPPPPAEIKALSAFVGEWRSAYEFMPAFMGQAGTGTGHTTCEWVLDGWYVMSKFEGTSTMGGYEAIGMMTYNPARKTYRSFHFSDHGDSDVADMTYEPESKTWTMSSEGPDPMTGKVMKNRNVMRFISPDQLEWEWSGQREGESGFAVFMKGTDTRVSPPQRK